MKTVWFLLLGFALSRPAEAAQICFQDVRSYEAVEAQLPAQIRGGQVYAVHNSWTMKGGFRVYQAGSSFVLEGKGHAILLGELNEDATIRNMCVNGNKIAVWLVDGRYDEMTIVPGGFVFHGYTFQITTPEVYARMTQ